MFPVGVEADALCREHRLAVCTVFIPPGQVNRAIRDCGRRRVCARCPAFVHGLLRAGDGSIPRRLLPQGCFAGFGARFMGARFKLSTPGRSTLCEARQPAGRQGAGPALSMDRRTARDRRDARGVLSRSAIDGRGWFCRGCAGLGGQPEGLWLRPGRPHGRSVSAGADRRFVRGGTHVFWRWLIKPIHHV